MDNNVFEEPVSICVGLSFPTTVETVAEAYAMLAEWPQNQRGSAHRLAMNACKAALAGAVDAETARGAFLRFAKNSGMLLPESDAVIAARETGGLRLQLPA